MLVIGKTIGGGIPVGTYGMTEAIAERVRASMPGRSDVGGVGGTLAGYALSLAAVRATLTDVLNDEAFSRMIPLAERWEAGVNDVIRTRGVPWHVTRLGARAEYHFMPTPPRDGAEQIAHVDPLLDKYLHLAVMNRGVLMTPFHNMALMSPATTAADVDRHTQVFGEVVDALVAGRQAPRTQAPRTQARLSCARASASSSRSRSRRRRCCRYVGASWFSRVIARLAVSTTRRSCSRSRC
jgi:glutamate-1-semialdehyde 2,1-aminomutase